MLEMFPILIFKFRERECKIVIHIVEKSKTLDIKEASMTSKLSHIQHTLT